MAIRPILCVFLFAFLIKETQQGIYIVMTPGKKTSCENQLKMLIGNTKVCISKKPIISVDEIESVTDIQYHPKIESYYFDVRFSQKGIHTLNTAISSLPETKFAMVSRNEVVCTFTVDPDKQIHFIRIGIGEELDDLKVVHAAAKQLIP